ncbi:hypothetical protein THAOC_28633 [Thalassiosira oceanica]|uniref:Uncharacterized protein n=1 Tax=Thalassiosira oceanica TaxID=159749 RepID=K0RFX1_THAOC|nr:hypothetical protein THAOC_28633 [Thalassiosira oceanica]|eukprot:EJK52130.1 hypothetical protein THAOC_28633 [Thalassiosira oceanica]
MRSPFACEATYSSQQPYPKSKVEPPPVLGSGYLSRVHIYPTQVESVFQMSPKVFVSHGAARQGSGREGAARCAWKKGGGPASGVRGDDGFYHARPSALYTPTGPFGRSVASFDLKQPSRRVASFQTPKIPQRRLETKAKAREIDPEHETEMNWSSVEAIRTIVLAVKCRADYDKATRKALYPSDKILRTNLSSASS